MRRNRTELVLGLVLILLGVWFIAQKQFPQYLNMFGPFMTFPLSLVLGGAVLFVFSLIFWSPNLIIPASILAGVGGIFYYQQISAAGSGSWSFLWTLIIGFVGVGNLLAGAFNRNGRQARSGMNQIVVSAVLFVIFAALTGNLTVLGAYGAYGPAVILILVGLWVLGRGLFRKGESS